jgi:hypothetical protein
VEQMVQVELAAAQELQVQMVQVEPLGLLEQAVRQVMMVIVLNIICFHQVILRRMEKLVQIIILTLL